MYVFLVQRISDGAYLHSRSSWQNVKFITEATGIPPRVYQKEGHAKTTVTFLSQNVYDKTHKGKYWWDLSDEEKDEHRKDFRVVKCELVPEAQYDCFVDASNGACDHFNETFNEDED